MKYPRWKLSVVINGSLPPKFYDYLKEPVMDYKKTTLPIVCSPSKEDPMIFDPLVVDPTIGLIILEPNMCNFINSQPNWRKSKVGYSVQTIHYS